MNDNRPEPAGDLAVKSVYHVIMSASHKIDAYLTDIDLDLSDEQQEKLGYAKAFLQKAAADLAES